MTFDLTPEQETLLAAARTAASLPSRAIDAVLVIEERATADPAEAARFGSEAAAGNPTTTDSSPGLTSAEAALASIPESNRPLGRLIAAAIALGVGRAAILHAREWMLSNGVTPGPDETVPHWAFADGATEVAAARMLTYNAAQMLDRGEDAGDAISRAHAFAVNTALRAVDAAIRVVGYSKGSVLERLSGEVRTLQGSLRETALHTGREAI